MHTDSTQQPQTTGLRVDLTQDYSFKPDGEGGSEDGREVEGERERERVGFLNPVCVVTTQTIFWDWL